MSYSLTRLRTLCLSLPEAEERPFGGHTSPAFRVRDKIFVFVSQDEGSMNVKVPSGVNVILVGDDDRQFFLPAYVASKGWVGVHFEHVVDLDEIDELVRESYRLIAPKRLAAQLDE